MPARPLGEPGTFNIVTPQEAGRFPRGTPQRVVMDWWRLIQHRAVGDSLALFTPEARKQLRAAGYGELLVTYVGPWIRKGKPDPQRVETTRPGRVVVFMETRFNAAVGNSLVRHRIDQLALSLERRGGRWLLSDPAWFLAQAAALKVTAEATRREAEQRDGD